MPRFRFPLKPEDAYRLLVACYANEVQYRNRQFEEHPDTLDRIWDMACFLTDEQPKFGAALMGMVGNGKTTLLYAFQQAVNFLNDRGLFGDTYKEYRDFTIGIQIFTAKDLVRIAKTDWPRFEKIRDLSMLAIDDLGAEATEVKDYGDTLTPVVDLIEARYATQKFTLITSNLDPEEIKEHYGERVANRLKEMVSYIIFGEQESFRR